MKLYHYSKDKYEILMNKIKQGKFTEKELKEQIEYTKETNSPGTYLEHISFFFDPAPLHLLGLIFGKGHHTWFDGNKLYEYIIDVDSLGDIPYNVVETPLCLKLLDNTEWVDTYEFFIKYQKNKYKLQRANGEIGNTLDKLKHQITLFQGKTSQYYLAAKQRLDAKDNFDKYAACVPHVMLYPNNGTIAIESINKVTVGNNNRTPIEITKSINSPNYLEW